MIQIALSITAADAAQTPHISAQVDPLTPTAHERQLAASIIEALPDMLARVMALHGHTLRVPPGGEETQGKN